MPHHELEPEPIKERGIRLHVKDWSCLIPRAEIDIDRKLSCEKKHHVHISQSIRWCVSVDQR